MIGLRMPVEGPGCQAHGATDSPGGIPRLLVREKLAQRGPSSRISAKKFAQHSPSSGTSAKKLAQRAIKHPFWAIFRVLGELFRAYTMTTVPQGELFRAHAHTHGQAERQISRKRRDNTATLKPTTPLHTHNKGPLKLPSPMHPKTAPKTPISHPQRRWRFQSHTVTSEQR